MRASLAAASSGDATVAQPNVIAGLQQKARAALEAGRFEEALTACRNLLAFAPGGLAEMSLIALALGIDAAYVSSHHVVRIFMIIVAAPLVFRLLGGRRG